MTYCATQWLSSYTYAGIRDRLIAEAALFPGAAPAGAVVGDPLVHVAGVVNLTRKTATIDYVTPLPGPAVQSAEPEETAVELRAILDDGDARSFPVELKPNLCRLPDEDETALVDVVIDVPDNTTALELLLDGDTVAAFDVGADPGPPVRNLALKVADGERGAAEGGEERGWRLQWDDAAGRSVAESNRSYVVQASTDEGTSWTTLAVGAKRPAVELDPGDFADAARVRFSVLTTNGVLYSEATTEDVVPEDV
jgi:hypothetical protein